MDNNNTEITTEGEGSEKEYDVLGTMTFTVNLTVMAESDDEAQVRAERYLEDHHWFIFNFPPPQGMELGDYGLDETRVIVNTYYDSDL